MTTHDPRNTAPKKHRPRGAKDKPVRDNVLGRRPGKTDPLGEQPGTLGRNNDAQSEPMRKDPDLPRPEDQVTNTDVDDRPTGGL